MENKTAAFSSGSLIQNFMDYFIEIATWFAKFTSVAFGFLSLLVNKPA
jgi:hypothetical protein